MKKRLLLLTQLLLAGCIALGVCACDGGNDGGDNGGNGQENSEQTNEDDGQQSAENQDNGGQQSGENQGNGGQENNVDKITYEEAVQLLTTTDNYSYKVFATFNGEFNDRDAFYESGIYNVAGNRFHEISRVLSTDSISEYQYEGYSLFEITESGNEREYSETYIKRHHNQLSENIELLTTDDYGEWSKARKTYDSEAEYEYALSSHAAIATIFFQYEYKISSTDTETHKLQDLYGQFSLNEEDNSYSASLIICDLWYINETPINYTFTFKDKTISSVYINLPEEGGGVSGYVEFFDYGTTVVEFPDEFYAEQTGKR